MDLVLDHAFILVEEKAKVADLLVSLGMQESFSRDHKGQGTSNRRFLFSNGMLEFLWVRDADEATQGPGRDLRFPERAISSAASPFGVILHRKNPLDLEMPFDGWKYQPDYFDIPRAFHVGNNSNSLQEPLCFYAPFITSGVPAVGVGGGAFKSITQVQIYTSADPVSRTLAVASTADRLSIEPGDQHLMVVTLDCHQQGSTKDFRPDIPLILHW